MEQRKFYVGILMKNGKIIGHGLSSKEQPFPPDDDSTKEPSKQQEETTQSKDALPFSFENVFQTFVRTMESYRNFLSLTLYLAPQLARAMVEEEIQEYVKHNGAKRPDLSTDNAVVYELDYQHFTQIAIRTDRVRSGVEGAGLLPEVVVVGLISAYDGFLASLLNVVINRHEEIVLTSQKELTFKELLQFKSIDEARSTLIEREIESVIRKSHPEQFDWMQNHLDVPLKSGLKVWPEFIELCERRNLFTHTGGIVSRQYLKVCSEHGCHISNVTVGDKLEVSPDYFEKAVKIVSEIGLKLCYVLWRKFDKEQVELADRRFNFRAMELIRTRSYDLAESLLAFSHQVPRVSDEIRRMMIVNLANAIRLQGREDEARNILDKHDWSATSDIFKICIASVKGQMEEVLKLMDAIGKGLDADNYRTWPVFRRTRDDARFAEKFEVIFGDPLVLPVKTITSGSTEAETQASSELTIH